VVGVPESAVVSGFITGTKYQRLTDAQKLGYVSGVMDSLAYSQLEPFTNCPDNIVNSQAQGIVDKYMKEHPEDWHYSMAETVRRALHSFCLKRVKENKGKP
jgi:hypothetical protein